MLMATPKDSDNRANVCLYKYIAQGEQAELDLILVQPSASCILLGKILNHCSVSVCNPRS